MCLGIVRLRVPAPGGSRRPLRPAFPAPSARCPGCCAPRHSPASAPVPGGSRRPLHPACPPGRQSRREDGTHRHDSARRRESADKSARPPAAGRLDGAGSQSPMLRESLPWRCYRILLRDSKISANTTSRAWIAAALPWMRAGIGQTARSQSSPGEILGKTLGSSGRIGRSGNRGEGGRRSRRLNRRRDRR